MFNFKVVNRALNDSNLSDKAFRMLYTITNYCSLKNSNSVEVHNVHLMMVLNLSERHIRRLTNELVEKGYITKTVNGTSKNKLANTYTLIDVEVNDTPTDSLCNEGNKYDTQKFPLTNNCDKNDDKNVPLKNNNKIYINNKLVNIGKYTTGGPIEIIPVIEDNNNELTNIIEYRNNEDMNRENEMNEERMNVMNELNEKMENENNVTPTLEDVLRQQAEEQNDLLREAYNDNFNFEEYSYEEIAKGSKRYNPDKQEQFRRVFTNSDNLIKEWKTTHNPNTKSQIESYISVVSLMYKFGEISQKQNEAFTNQITNNFNKLLKGHSEYLKNKKYSSTIFSNKNPQPPRPEENENKAVLSHENDSDIQTIIEDNKTQQGANKAAKMAIVERECKAPNKQFNFDTMEMIVNYINSFVESRQVKEEWINRYFNGISHKLPSYIEAMKHKALSEI